MSSNNLNVGAGNPNLGGGRGVPSPPENVLAWLKVLRHNNEFLVEAFDEVVIVDGPLKPPQGTCLQSRLS